MADLSGLPSLQPIHQNNWSTLHNLGMPLFLEISQEGSWQDLALVALPLPSPQETGRQLCMLLRKLQDQALLPWAGNEARRWSRSLCHLLGVLPLAPTFLPTRALTAVRHQGKCTVYGPALSWGLQAAPTSACPPGCWQKWICSCLGLPAPSMTPAALWVPWGMWEPGLSTGQQSLTVALRGQQCSSLHLGSSFLGPTCTFLQELKDLKL